MLSESCITGSRGIVKKGVEVMLVREILYVCGVKDATMARHTGHKGSGETAGHRTRI